MNLRLSLAGALVLVVVTAAAESADTPKAPPTEAVTSPDPALVSTATRPTVSADTEVTASNAVPSAPAEPAEKRVVQNGRLPEAKRTERNKFGRMVLPDVDLLDGSSYEKEKRPLRGMLSEIELGETDGGPQSKVSPESGAPGGSQQPPKPDDPKTGGASTPQNVAQNQAAGGAADATPPNATQGGGGAAGQKIPEGQMAGGGAGGPESPNGQASAGGAGPAATAEGMQAANLRVPEGAANAVGAATGKPQQMQIGDAALQIQTSAENNSDVVGTQASNSQQFDRKVGSGGSATPTAGNVGVEKGRVVPKGL